MFFRLTRTDSVHHLGEKELDLSAVAYIINSFSTRRDVFVSREIPLSGIIPENSLQPDLLHIHEELLKCAAFWGNSPTMAAESALLGVPAVYVGTGKFAYIRELETSGMVFCYSPVHLDDSLTKLEELLEQADRKQFRQLRDRLLKDKIDMTELFYWFITDYPRSARIIATDRNWQSRFRLSV